MATFFKDSNFKSKWSARTSRTIYKEKNSGLEHLIASNAAKKVLERLLEAFDEAMEDS